MALAMLLLVAACTTGGSGDERGDSPSDDHRAVAGTCVAGEADADPLPEELEGDIERDADIEVTTLDNGLTVYVRENQAPGGRAQLGLVVAAGSAQQSDDQSGVAHFVEHMLFNGTERWPENELLPVLERFGTQIGPDLNAFTSYDDTQYWLEVATTEPDALDLALDVLREWATGATMTPEQVTAERGVVAEELRLRDEGADGRIRQAFEAAAFLDTPYEDRSPGGDLDSVESMEPATLLDFYDQWYQPQLMAVVAVGDFEGDDVLDAVEQRFDDLDEGATDRPDLEVEPWSEPRYAAFVEPEATLASASVFFALDPLEVTTAGDRRAEWVRALALDLVTTRLSDDISRGDLALTSASHSPQSPVAALALPSIDVDGTPADLEAGIEATLEELERVCRFGFTQAEFDRVVAGYRAAIDQEYDSRTTKQDQQWAFEYADGFLHERALPDPRADHELDTAILDAITPEEVAAWFVRTYADSPPSIFAVGPDEDELPTDTELRDLATQVRDADLRDRAGVEIDGEGLMDRPAPAAVVDREELPPPFEGVRLTFENGVQVVLDHSDIHSGHVDLGGTSPGGLSVLADKDVAAGQLLGSVLGQSGVGSFDQVTLETLLADRDVQVQVGLGDVEEQVFGAASVDDLETMLQLVHLYLSEPQVTDAALTAVKSEVLPLAADPGLDPETAIFQELLDARYGGEPRYLALPDPDLLEQLEAGQVRRVAEEQLTGSGDFVFGIVGDFDVDETEDLVASYLGTLSSEEGAPFEDVAPDPPAGVVTREVTSGAGDQGRLLLLYTELGPVDFETEMTLEVLGTLASTRLREVIREQLSATYAPDLQTDVTREPDEGLDLLVDIGADPERLVEVSQVARDQLAQIAAGDFSADELERARTSVARDYELWDNLLLIETHLSHARHPEARYGDFLTRSLTVETVSAERVAALATALFASDEYIEIVERPAG